VPQERPIQVYQAVLYKLLWGLRTCVLNPKKKPAVFLLMMSSLVACICFLGPRWITRT
jgi:hypothetical protein